MITPARDPENGNPGHADDVAPLGTPATVVPLTRTDDTTDAEDRLPGRPLQWLFMMIVAALVGAVAGAVGGAFRLALDGANHARDAMIVWAHGHATPWLGWIIPCALCATGAGVGCWLTQRLAPRTAGSGIPRVKAVLRNRVLPAGPLVLPVKFFGGALSIGSGLALGREGPTVQMGGTIGHLLCRLFRRIVPEPWTMIAAGAGAGLAVAFNAPLAATLFVMEELLHRFSARVFSATLMACMTGTVVLRMIVGKAPDFAPAGLPVLSADVLPQYLLLGALAGLLGVGFNVSLLGSLRLFDRAAGWPKGSKGAAVGAAAGLLAWFAPTAVGGGEKLAQFAIVSHPAWSAVVWLLVIRFTLTMASYGSGSPGGIFAPLLALGALLGSGFALADAYFRHAPFDPSAFVIVSMAACFTAIIRSPLTGVVLLLEMTGGWTLILPMMAASVTAYAIPELLGNPPVYDSLMERDARAERIK
jgi:CIC family chloride channel protein